MTRDEDSTGDPAPSAAARTARRPLAVRALRALVGLVFVVLATEGLVRVGLVALGRPYSPADFRGRIERERLAMDDGMVGKEEAARTERALQPYVGFWTPPLWNQVERAYQSGEVLVADDRPGFEVWILGGSVAGNFGKESGGRTPFLKALGTDPRFLAALPGVRPRLYNFAHAAHKQPQQASLVAFLLSLGLEPDAIVCLDGFNEIAVANANQVRGLHPAYPAVMQWSSLASNPAADPRKLEGLMRLWTMRDDVRRLADRALDWNVHHSALLGHLALDRVTRARGQWVRKQRSYLNLAVQDETDMSVTGPAVKGEFVRDAMIRAWSEGSRTLHAIATARGIPYLHVLQPTLHDEGAKPWTEEETRTSKCSKEWLEGVAFGYPRLREEGARLHEEHGIAFLDASFVFADVEETLYYDACHFNRRGNEILAEVVADALAAQFE